MMRYIALLGHPLGHSISPRFQQAALDHYGLDVRYQAWDTGPGQLGEVVGRLRQPWNLGANVTVPYKETVLPLLDRVEGVARKVAAVNTIVNEEGGLIGYNTDATGFMQSLRVKAGFESRGRRVVLLGAGGAARAVAFALIEGEIASMTIFNRTLERGRGLVEALMAEVKAGQWVGALPWEEASLRKTLSSCDLVVNCTTIGMRHGLQEGQTPLRAEVLHRDMLVCDLVYNPVETPLIEEARKAGARTLGGVAMLVYQGAASFRLWLGREAPVDIMFDEAHRALGGD